MKKITLFAVVLFVSFAASAQNFYNFSSTQENYTDLQEPTSLNNGEVWDYDYYGNYAMPFEFSLNGTIEIDRFVFDDDYFLLLTPNANLSTDEGVYYLSVNTFYIQDREYSTGNAASEINYTVEGTEGNRILKLEIKNAGLEDAQDFEVDENYYYLSYQIWIYEADQSIEYRYGDSNLSNLDTNDILDLTYGDGMIVGFGGNNDMANFVSGTLSSPEYNEYTMDNLPSEDFTLSTYPENGTVYRFAPSGTASVDDFNTAKLEVYPNPATNILNINQKNLTQDTYTITDITGKTVMQNKVSGNTTQINVESLTPGMYFLNVNNQNLKFIKK